MGYPLIDLVGLIPYDTLKVLVKVQKESGGEQKTEVAILERSGLYTSDDFRNQDPLIFSAKNLSLAPMSGGEDQSERFQDPSGSCG